MTLIRISMTRYLFLLMPFWVACHSAQPVSVATPPPPAVSVQAAPFVTWDKKLVALGTVKKGEQRTLFYEFTNTSAEPIQIEIVDACDCTKVEFPRGKIAPGAKGRLDVVFNSTEKDASETIGINVIFVNTKPDGTPRIEMVEYSFELIK